MLHAKIFQIDGWTTVGSSNLDDFILLHNSEVDLGLTDRGALAAVDRQLAMDLSQSQEVTLESYEQRGRGSMLWPAASFAVFGPVCDVKTLNMKVLSYNIHKGFSPLGLRSTLGRTKTSLQQLDAELVFLQEVAGPRSETRRTPHRLAHIVPDRLSCR